MLEEENHIENMLNIIFPDRDKSKVITEEDILKVFEYMLENDLAEPV